MSDHLAVLQVLVPLLAAPLCALIGRRKIVHGLTLAACGVTFAIAIALAMRVASSGAASGTSSWCSRTWPRCTPRSSRRGS